MINSAALDHYEQVARRSRGYGPEVSLPNLVLLEIISAARVGIAAQSPPPSPSANLPTPPAPSGARPRAAAEYEYDTP
jgi:hypothetical protein